MCGTVFARRHADGEKQQPCYCHTSTNTVSNVPSIADGRYPLSEHGAIVMLRKVNNGHYHTM